MYFIKQPNLKSKQIYVLYKTNNNIYMSEHNNNENTVRRCRYPGCGSEGHDRRKCARRFREEEERVTGIPIPIVYADNNEELRRIRELTNTRRREEREAVRVAAEARYPVVPQNALPGAALEGNALQRRDAELAQQAQNLIVWREREARRMALADQVIELDEGAPPPPPNMDGIPLADRWRVWRDYEHHGAPPNMVTDEGLARMVALPVLRETAVEATECPICIEDLGETGKTVLKCGHILCLSCFLQQVLRATAMRSTNGCACPVCRVNYIM